MKYTNKQQAIQLGPKGSLKDLTAVAPNVSQLLPAVIEAETIVFRTNKSDLIIT